MKLLLGMAIILLGGILGAYLDKTNKIKAPAFYFVLGGITVELAFLVMWILK